MIRTILLCAVILGAASAAADETVKPSPGPGMVKVSDPAASGGWCAAAILGGEGGKAALAVPKLDLARGRYRAAVRMRLHLPPGYDHGRLEPTFTLLAEDGPRFVLPLASPLFNGAQGAYTEFAGEFSLSTAAHMTAEISWSIASVPMGERPRLVAPVKAPSGPDVGGALVGSDDVDDGVGVEELLGAAIPIEKLSGAALFTDRLTITPLAAEVMVEKVWPEKVHVYPGGENPISVTLRNLTDRPLRAAARLTVFTGLDEGGPSQEAELELPARGTATHRFPWKAGKREFGHEARVEAVLNGKAVHFAAEYFSVSSPVWKTAIQGSGFITWHGREWDFDRHVEENRAAYVNVEEAFSWQPSSWTDLTPQTEEWWSGQCDFHNSMAGLKKWIGLSHGHGIKMITYIWPTASGRDGFEWARRNPHLATHVGVGLATEFFDVEDLRLWDAVRDDPTLWRLHYGVWQSMGINRGLLENMVTAADEVVQSAKRFGWDGIRFDCPPGWSAMGAKDVHDEFERLGLTELMAKLVPEHYSTGEGIWNSLAVSTRNVRYFRHRFSQDLGADFAVSYNNHIEQPLAGDIGKIEDEKERDRVLWLRELCCDNQQMMNEAIRASGTWAAYLDAAMTHAEAVRRLGGHSCLVALNKGGVMARVYAPVFTFAVGSHSYLDYGWRRPMPGPYSRFATRYGEFFWDRNLVPVTPEEAGITVAGREELLWRRFVRRRALSDGSVQTIVHLITLPPVDDIYPTAAFPLPAWQRDVAVRMSTAASPTVWRLTAEPKLVCERLETKRFEDGIVVTVPEHRYWTILVFTQEKKE